MVIRPLALPDWAPVLRIYAEGIATGNATFELETPSETALDARWVPGQRWVADVEGAVAGWAALSATSARECYAGVVESSIYTAADRRGTGVGTALLDHQIAAADAAGLWTVQASIFPENADSLALYRRAGFRDVGVRERMGQHHGRWRDVLLLERRSPAIG